MPVYEILRSIMEEKGLSVADTARICNLPDSTVRGIIRRKQETIALEVAFKLSSGLGVSLERLNGITEKEKPASGEDSELSQINAIFSQLSPDNRAKLIELAHLYLDAQRKKEESP